MTKKKETFEDALKRMQEISELLESDSVGLEESMQLYEEGVMLSKKCFKQLEEAELKITELKKQLSE